MGSGASAVSREDVQSFPQYHILGGDAKFDELQEDGMLNLDKVKDPYLQYGGRYAGDVKDTKDFKYVTFDELPAFTPSHRSLMAKVLTPELFEKLKGLRSSKGYTLSNAIMTGVVTPHLGVGATAGDEECWELFKDLFYPIIKGWHGYDANLQKQPVDLDASKLRFSDAQRELFAKYVVSTRVRAARNISGFALPAGTTEEERAGVEEVLKQAFAALNGELSGTYYELGALSAEQTAHLQERGFLFQLPSARNLLTGAGAARSWPRHRGIFFNEQQTALCWVNEEDHCRIISMELGGDIPSVFTRFVCLANALQTAAAANGTKLMWSDTLGFLGSCPSNLGTGLRASVMVTLPAFNRLMESAEHRDRELLDEVCAAFDLQPRGSAGEHSAAVGGRFDISNKQRLGTSEVALVQKMIDGVAQVIRCEQLLEQGATPEEVRQQIDRLAAQTALRTIFVGPPGSGKGTQAPLMKSLFGLAHLSTGDMLRDAVARGTELGLQAKAVMESGKLVGDELVAQIVAEVIGRPDCRKGFILDGFPRTEAQAVILDQLLAASGTAIDCVINLAVPDDLLVQRITGRLIHPPSGRSYNIYFNPPLHEGLDDVTGEALVKRADDTEDKLRTRLEEFHSKTTPVLAHYGDRVVDIKADDGMDAIAQRIQAALTAIAERKKQQAAEAAAAAQA